MVAFLLLGQDIASGRRGRWRVRSSPDTGTSGTDSFITCNRDVSMMPCSIVSSTCEDGRETNARSSPLGLEAKMKLT